MPAPSASAADETTLTRYLAGLRRHWWLILVIAAGCTIGAAIAASHRTLHYDASASVVVTPNSRDDRDLTGFTVVQDTGDPSRTIQTAAAIVGSAPAAAATAAALADGTSASQVRGAIRVQPRGESNVLAVTARANSAERAARLANEYTRQSLELRRRALMAQLRVAISQLRARLSRPNSDPSGAGAQRLEALQAAYNARRDPTLALSEQAVVPGSAIGVSKRVLIGLGAIGGLAAGMLAALALTLLDPRIRDTEALSLASGLPILVSVAGPSRRAGPRALESLGRDGADGLRRASAQLGSDARVVLVAGPPGARDTAVTAAGLATALADGGFKISLVGVNPAGDDLVRRVDERPGLRVLAAANGALRASDVAPAIEEERNAADYVIVDAGALEGNATGLTAASEADTAVLVARLGTVTAAEIQGLTELAERLHAPPVGIVATGASRRSMRRR